MDKSSTTKQYDPAELSDQQRAGLACVVCHAEPDSMRPVGSTTHGQVFACTTCPVDQADTELPESWARDAEKAAARAHEVVKSQYECTMKALRKDAGEDRPRAFWLESHPCPAWCAHPESHRSGDHPVDRFHDSDSHAVNFDTMEASTAYAEYLAPEMRLFLTQGYREAEARVAVFEGNTLAWATLDEAEALAFAALALVRKARGQESLKVQPYDGHGRCTTKDCTLCHVQATA